MRPLVLFGLPLLLLLEGCLCSNTGRKGPTMIVSSSAARFNGFPFGATTASGAEAAAIVPSPHPDPLAEDAAADEISQTMEADAEREDLSASSRRHDEVDETNDETHDEDDDDGLDLSARRDDDEEDDVDEGLYSRQLYVMGRDAQRRLSRSSVLVIGLGPVGAELCKNLALAGVRRIALLDDAPPTPADRAANWILAADAPVDVDAEPNKPAGVDAPPHPCGGSGRAARCARALAALNEHVLIELLAGDKWYDTAASAASKFDVVVAADEYGAQSKLARRAATLARSIGAKVRRVARRVRSSRAPRVTAPLPVCRPTRRVRRSNRAPIQQHHRRARLTRARSLLGRSCPRHAAPRPVRRRERARRVRANLLRPRASAEWSVTRAAKRGEAGWGACDGGCAGCKEVSPDRCGAPILSPPRQGKIASSHLVFPRMPDSLRSCARVGVLVLWAAPRRQAKPHLV